jgi:flagellar biosynthetic protein FlhB
VFDAFVEALGSALGIPQDIAQRLFSKEIVGDLMKNLFKFTIGVVVAFLVVNGAVKTLPFLPLLGLREIEAISIGFVTKAFVYAFMTFLVIAVLDYIYERWKFERSIKMTKEEIREEFKETEGNPEIKAKVRQLRARQARQRMMARVPKATVVVTNPTHFAVALQYESGMAAPICVAKGVDALALKIREIAGGAEVPVVENPPLARALYATVEIDEEIPTEHYQAVAEVIGYVLRLKRRRA